MNDLKPCPFCGGEVEISTYRNEGYQIECPNHEWPKREIWGEKRPESDIAADIGMFTWGISDEAKTALIEAWNTRTPEQAIAATFGEQRGTAEIDELLDEFENECFMLRVEASETRAKDEVVREAYERIREASAQAIAATLGGGKLTAEQVMAIAGRHQPDYCSDTHVCFDWQAIADELNATLGGGECHLDEVDNYSNANEVVHVLECSACGETCEHVNGSYPRCPHCGRKSVEHG